MMIDAHQHVWRIARGDYGWLTPDLQPLYRDYGPDDLAPFLKRHDIARTILVQAAPTVAETEFMLSVARETPTIAGVVGWIDFEAVDAGETIARLARDELLVGLRPMVQDLPDDNWLMRRDIDRAIDAMRDYDLVFDALVKPRHLPALRDFVQRHRDLAIVVDHLAKPAIADGALDPWRADLAMIAAHPHVACKLSGVVTEASTSWTVDDLRPYLDHALTIFGARRLLLGFDWPVVNLAGGYDRWREASLKLLRDLNVNDRAAILGDNAARLYLSKRGRRA